MAAVMVEMACSVARIATEVWGAQQRNSGTRAWAQQWRFRPSSMGGCRRSECDLRGLGLKIDRIRWSHDRGVALVTPRPPTLHRVFPKESPDVFIENALCCR